jgi:hypothetical protein
MSVELLRNQIDLIHIPFTERGSRLMLFRSDHQLYIRLAERWTKWEHEVGHYRERPPIFGSFTLLDADNTTITAVEIETYPHCVRYLTAHGVFEWAFFDPETILVRLPSGHFGFQFTVFAQEGKADFRGGTLRGKRQFAYTTNARIVSNQVTRQNDTHFEIALQVDSCDGDTLLLNITPRLAFNRSIPNPDDVIDLARKQWQSWLAAPPPVLERYQKHYQYAWWIMRAGLLNTRYYFTREALVPSMIHYVGVWHWDQVFHALAYRHVDTKLAEDQLRIVLDHQRSDGMLPDAIHDEGTITHLQRPVDADVTKPPIMTWAVMKLYEASRHEDFLYEVYEPLTRWNQWWLDHHRDENGLCVYQHPFSSGLDDHPLWDHGMPVTSPDLNTYLVLQQENLAKIARLIGEDEAAESLEQAASDLYERMLTHLWDEERGYFRAYNAQGTIPTFTPIHLLPLLTGKLSQPIADALVKYLFDPDHFWTAYPLATVSRQDPAFDPEQMWRGPVWVNINYLFVEALKRSGYPDQAAELRRKTLDMIIQHSDIYEYYNPLTGERAPKAAPMFGWSAALFIELALDETRQE